MYNKEQSISISCNNCGDVYIDEHTGFSLYPDEIGAHEAADSDGWHSSEGEHYCPLCHKINDNEELIIDSGRTILHEVSVPVKEDDLFSIPAAKEVAGEDVLTPGDIKEGLRESFFKSTGLQYADRLINYATFLEERIVEYRQSHPVNTGDGCNEFPVSQVVFFELKNRRYLASNGKEITTEMLLKHEHALFHDNGYIILPPVSINNLK